MTSKTKRVESLSPNEIESIIDLNFDNDDIDNISKSVKEIGYEPVIVRPKGDGKYQLCSHPEVLVALNVLGKKKIDVIKRDISEKQGKELTLALLFRNLKISSKDRELLVWTLWKTGWYKTYVELGIRLGISGEHISDLIYGKEQREKLFGTEGPSEDISTDTLRLIKKYSFDDQKKFCNRINDKKILPSDVPEAVKFINSRTKDCKDAILDGKLPWKEYKNVIEKQQIFHKTLLNKLINKYENPKELQQIIEKEMPYFTAETFRDFSNFLKEFDTIYFDNITDETEKKQADAEENIAYALFTWYMLIRGKITPIQYTTVLEWFKMNPETVERLKDDGHKYDFSDECLTPEDLKLQEKKRKIKTDGMAV